MKFFTLFKKEKLRNWIEKNAESPRGTALLATVSFSEAIFFPIPPDLVLIGIVAMRKVQRWFFYSTVTLVFSILGGLAGYLIGYLFFDAFGQSVISFYHLESSFEKISAIFKDQTFFAILVAALTPIPFKLFTLAAGLFKVNIFTFLVAAILGRAIRFYLVGYLTKLYGPKAVEIFFKFFNIISVILVIIIILVLFFIL